MNKRKFILLIAALVLISCAAIFYFTSKVTYTKEFSYLPSYKNMKAEKYEPGKDGDFGNAIYYVSNEEFKSFLTEYQKILKKNGWKITLDKKPDKIEASKGNHIVKINVLNSKDKLTIMIWSK